MKDEGLDSQHSKQETLLAANGQHVAEVQLQKLAILTFFHHPDNQQHLHTASDIL